MVHKYHALGMDSLARLIARDWDQEALEHWQQRYGREYPVYAIIDGQEMRFEFSEADQALIKFEQAKNRL